MKQYYRVKLLELKIDEGFITQLMIVIIIYILLLGVCSNENFSKMMHHEILSEEEFFREFYADIFSDCLSDIYTSVSENDSSSEYSSDSDDVNTRPTKRQKTIVIDSDMESVNETHGAGEGSFASTEEWTEDIAIQLEDSTGVSGVTIECNNSQSVSEITELVSG